jgi:clan AA aspartic protease
VIYGHVRDDFPYVMLALRGLEGPLPVEFVVDTGFNGELALPGDILRQLDASFTAEETVQMADGSRRRRPYYEITLDWGGEERLTEVMLLEGTPLLGTVLLRGYLLQGEMADGGQVLVEPL